VCGRRPDARGDPPGQGPAGPRTGWRQAAKPTGRLTNYEFTFRKKSGELRTGLVSAELRVQDREEWGKDPSVTYFSPNQKRLQTSTFLNMTAYFAASAPATATWGEADNDNTYF
jgi:hypothetical protein